MSFFFVLERGGEKEGFYFIRFASNKEELVFNSLIICTTCSATN